MPRGGARGRQAAAMRAARAGRRQRVLRRGARKSRLRRRRALAESEQMLHRALAVVLPGSRPQPAQRLVRPLAAASLAARGIVLGPQAGMHGWPAACARPRAAPRRLRSGVEACPRRTGVRNGLSDRHENARVEARCRLYTSRQHAPRMVSCSTRGAAAMSRTPRVRFVCRCEPLTSQRTVAARWRPKVRGNNAVASTAGHVTSTDEGAVRTNAVAQLPDAGRAFAAAGLNVERRGAGGVLKGVCRRLQADARQRCRRLRGPMPTPALAGGVEGTCWPLLGAVAGTLGCPRTRRGLQRRHRAVQGYGGKYAVAGTVADDGMRRARSHPAAQCCAPFWAAQNGAHPRTAGGLNVACGESNA